MTDLVPSNQCDVCGAPATQWVGDPWGKSNVTRPKCAEHGVRLRDPAGIAEIERLRAALADVAKRLKTGYEPGCDCGGCRTMRYAEKALIGVAVETSEGLTVQQRVQRGLDTLEAMSNAWAESIGLEAMAANIARTPDFNKRLDAIHAFVIQAHVEGLYTGRTSLETEPPRAAEKASGPTCNGLCQGEVADAHCPLHGIAAWLREVEAPGEQS